MGTPIPNRENESKGIGSSPVKTYRLSPEELEKLRGSPVPKVTDRDGVEEKQPITLVTRQELRERRDSMEQEKPKTKYPHITKEFLESEFAKGKSGLQVEREQGLPLGTIGKFCKKFGVKSQYKPISKRTDQSKANQQGTPVDTSAAGTPTVDLPDMVNHPPHYTAGAVECIDAIEAATIGLTGSEAYCTGAAIKYLWRWKRKNGIEDLKKARWYLDRLIDAAK